jgi:hypothetical protein
MTVPGYEDKRRRDWYMRVNPRRCIIKGCAAAPLSNPPLKTPTLCIEHGMREYNKRVAAADRCRRGYEVHMECARDLATALKGFIEKPRDIEELKAVLSMAEEPVPLTEMDADTEDRAIELSGRKRTVPESREEVATPRPMIRRAGGYRNDMAHELIDSINKQAGMREVMIDPHGVRLAQERIAEMKDKADVNRILLERYPNGITDQAEFERIEAEIIREVRVARGDG